MSRALLALCLAIIVVAAHAQSNTMCAPPNPTRLRDCAPWGLNKLNSDEINPAFRYSWPDEEAIDKCTGVINTFYFFKVTVFAARLETSVQMRALKAISEILWNVNAHFTDKATDTLGMLLKIPDRRTPKNARSIRERNIAIAVGLARVAAYVMPDTIQEVNDVLDLLLLDTGLDHKVDTKDWTKPEGIGNACSEELIASLKADGWNSEGDMTPGPNDNFKDYTGFSPVNKWNKMYNPTRWQPIREVVCNKKVIQQHTTPQVRSPLARTHAVSRSFINKKKGRGTGFTMPLQGKVKDWYMGNVTKLIGISAGLTDEQKLIAEFFDKKVVSFGGFERWYAHKNNWCHDQWIFFEQLTTAFYDATMLAWKEKIRVDAVRPVSAVHWLASQKMLPKKIKSWGGPGKGTVSMSPSKWRSYMRTMPHSEYPSGTSCLCSVFVEWVRKFQKSDKIGLTLNWRKGCSLVEPDVTPRADFSYTFDTLSQLLDVCATSRMWAGVHFEASIRDGQSICSGVADRAYKRVKQLWKGKLH